MTITVKGVKRELFGKNASRSLRREGKVPVILYGPNASNVPLVVFKKDIINILRSETGENTIFKISFDSGSHDVMIKEIQKDPVTDELLHVDLILIAMDKIIRVSVPIVPVGEAVGVKAEGGFVDFVTREVEIECLPKNIPENIETDISSLHIHQSIKVADVVPPEGVEIVSDEDTILVLIEVPRKEEEIVEEEKEEEVIAEEEEPEVVKREKEEDVEKEKEEQKESKEKS